MKNHSKYYTPTSTPTEWSNNNYKRRFMTSTCLRLRTTSPSTQTHAYTKVYYTYIKHTVLSTTWQWKEQCQNNKTLRPHQSHHHPRHSTRKRTWLRTSENQIITNCMIILKGVTLLSNAIVFNENAKEYNHKISDEKYGITLKSIFRGHTGRCSMQWL